MINKERACELLADIKGKKILIVGDLMLDRYVIGSVTRISPEAPVPVLLVRHENALPGGAANVALNIRSLGGRAIIAGIMGKDKPGADLTSLLKSEGIRTDGVLYRKGGKTTVKTRVMAERQQVIRIDHEDAQTGPDGHTPALCRKIRSLIERGVDGVIVEDYGKGVICQEVVDVIMTCAKKKKIPVGYDPKDDRIKIRGLALATPNYKEALKAAGMDEMPLSEPPIRDSFLRKAGKILKNKWGVDLLAVTLGAHGIYLLSGRSAPAVVPAKAREVFDVSGAGDTVIATAMLGLAAGGGHEESMMLANYAAGVVVGKVGTATCSPEELLGSMER